MIFLQKNIRRGLKLPGLLGYISCSGRPPDEHTSTHSAADLSRYSTHAVGPNNVHEKKHRRGRKKAVGETSALRLRGKKSPATPLPTPKRGLRNESTQRLGSCSLASPAYIRVTRITSIYTCRPSCNDGSRNTDDNSNSTKRQCRRNECLGSYVHAPRGRQKKNA